MKISTRIARRFINFWPPSSLPEFQIDITGEAGTLIARVKRVIYIRKKRGVA